MCVFFCVCVCVCMCDFKIHNLDQDVITALTVHFVLNLLLS